MDEMDKVLECKNGVFRFRRNSDLEKALEYTINNGSNSHSYFVSNPLFSTPEELIDYACKRILVPEYKGKRLISNVKLEYNVGYNAIVNMSTYKGVPFDIKPVKFNGRKHKLFTTNSIKKEETNLLFVDAGPLEEKQNLHKIRGIGSGICVPSPCEFIDIRNLLGRPENFIDDYVKRMVSEQSYRFNRMEFEYYKDRSLKAVNFWLTHAIIL